MKSGMKPTRSQAPRFFVPCRLLMVGLLVLLLPLSALGQGYFRVSPGPLNEGHSAYDNSDGCTKCHESAQGVTNQKCLACHKAVQHKGGLHGTFGGKPCLTCHIEHKGRAFNIIDWKSVGGRETFKHELTGFKLTEHHGQVACAQCHVKRLKTGRISYLGLSKECQSCHAKAHGFTRAELSQKCEICHQPGQSLKGQLLRQWLTPHTQHSKVKFEGKHTAQPCVGCHKGAKMPSRNVPRDCVDCHVPTHPVTPKTRNCIECHAQTDSFKGSKINHNKYGFPLTAKHARTSCASCHLRGRKVGPGRKLSKACVSCHAPTHPVVKATANCLSCHTSGETFKGAQIEHSKFGLGLFGKHRSNACSSCHTKPKVKPQYQNGDCTSCHTHRDAHQGQFRDKPCAKCHVEGGERKTPFDHSVDTRFPLKGYHAKDRVKNDCLLCHPGRLYRTGTIACADCHVDKHKGELGKDCAKCHSVDLKFNAPRSKDFEHAAFPLEGKHRTTPCLSCHVGGIYKLGKRRCYDCHRKDDKHRGKLGQDCGKCHRPEKGAPKFNHESMTRFPRQGAHAEAACSHCHQPKSPKHPALSVTEWKKTAKAAVDLTFPVRGKRCVDCHRDPHAGNVGIDCAACHNVTDFARISGARAKAIRPKDHGGAWLRRHTILPDDDGEPGAESRSCALCHGSPSCTHCHRTTPPRSHTGVWRIRTHGAAASFAPEACSTCHRAASCIQCHRRTPPLNHRGAWRNLHGFASGGFGDSNCFVCHRRSECALCHRSR